MKLKFNKEENQILTEIYRSLNYFHHGKLDEPLVVLEYPSNMKSLVKIGMVKSYSRERPKELNWYSLTEKGQNFFKKYSTKKRLSQEMSMKIFEGKYVKEFNYKLFK